MHQKGVIIGLGVALVIAALSLWWFQGPQQPTEVLHLKDPMRIATTFIDQHSAQALMLTAPRHPPDTAMTRKAWEQYVFALRLDQSLLLTLEDIARWAIRHHLTEATTVPNFLDAMYFQALQEVKPEAITIIR